MEFNGFKVFPAANGPYVTAEEQRVLGEIIESSGLLDSFPKHPEIVVELAQKNVPAGDSLIAAHDWLPEPFFARSKTPAGLLRQPDASTVPAGMARATVRLIRRRSGGMGSLYGFEGHFLSLIISLNDRLIWDARGEEAT